MQAHLTAVKEKRKLFSTAELLLVLVMVSVIAGFAVVSLVRANRSALRTNTAVEIANHLKKARLDSMRRGATDVNQMAQVKIFNRRSYSVTIDADNDGYVDVPVNISLPQGAGVEFNGPFPKTYIFDWQGQTVDSQNQRVTPQPMKLGNSSGASAIKFSDGGKITVVPSLKLTAAR
jgi:type II secretory pathway pseudopilin PulG